MLLGGLGLRLWGIDHGLPAVYNPDEKNHFVSIAVSFFERDSLDPDYFVNPPALTYLFAAVYAAWYGLGNDVVEAFAVGSNDIWIIGRVVVALIGVFAAWLTFVAGSRLFNRGVGLLAALLVSVGFLPVFQSHFALNDIPALAAATLGLVGAVGILRRGWLLDYAVAGVGTGLAVATKYTAGVILLTVLLAAASRVGATRRRAATGVGIVLAAALISFLVTNPYSVLDSKTFLEDIGLLNLPSQGPEKLGQPEENGVLYYLSSLTWGLGWVPSILALAGAVRLWFTDRWAFAILVPPTVLLILFMGLQERFFARWLLPVYPLVALLAAYSANELFREVSRRAPRYALPAVALAAAALCGQSVVHAVHTDLVLTREDTRTIARNWLGRNIPAGTRMVIEPTGVVETVGSPWRTFIARPTLVKLGLLDPTALRAPQGEQYVLGLDPRLIDVYERKGFCYVLVGTLQRGRALATPNEAPGAVEYYRELERVGKVVYRASPYDDGEAPLAFDFGKWNNLYPLAFHRPGPEVTLYELLGGDCGDPADA